MKNRFMNDLLEESKRRDDKKLIEVSKAGNFKKAVKEISERDDAKEILSEILKEKPQGQEVIEYLSPHFGTKGLYSVLKQAGKIIAEDNFNQGVNALKIMENYAGNLDVCSMSREINEIEKEVGDISSLEKVFNEKYKNLEGKEFVIQSLKNQKNTMFDKSYLEIVEGWDSNYVFSVIRDLQNKRGLAPTLYALKSTAKKIQKKEAMEGVAILSRGLSYDERADKMKGLTNIILFKGDYDNFNKILDLGKKANKESVHYMGQIALWIDDKKMYNELLDMASNSDISYELSRLEGVAFYNNEKIFEDNFNVLKKYIGNPASKRIMKKLSRINTLSENEFVSKYTAKLATDYQNNSNRDKYLAEIQRYCHKGDFEKAKKQLIKYNKPSREDNLENRLSSFVSKFKH